MKAALLALFLALASLSGARAVTPSEVLPDPALEARARAISAELRCLVCQNQSIDDSDADLARDLRVLVRERLVAGDSDEEVKDFLVDRYGEFVLLKPRFSSTNLALWLTPLLALALGALLAFAAFRRRPASPGPARLSPEEEAALAAFVGRDAAESDKLTKV